MATHAPLAAWYQAFVLAVLVAVLYTNLPVYAYLANPFFLPKFFFFGLFALMLPTIVGQHKQLAAYLLSPFALWASLFLLLNLVHLAGMNQAGELGGSFVIDRVMEARRELVLTRMQYVVFAMAAGFVVHTCGEWQRRTFLKLVAVLAILVPAAVIVDFLHPGVFYSSGTPGSVIGRAAAMYINPTMAGEVLLHVFLLACAVVPARLRGPLLLLAGAAVVTTFSRSAMLAWMLIFLVLVCTRVLPTSALLLSLLGLGLAALSIGFFESYLLARGDFEGASGNVLARLDFFSSFSLVDDSSQERSEVLAAGWELFMQNPVFGAGPGATQFWAHRGGTHNQLLMFAAEYGFMGIGIWLWMLAILWQGRFFEERGLQVAMVVLFLVMSMFTHLMLDVETYWLVSFALASVRIRPVSSAQREQTSGRFGTEQDGAAALDRFAWSYAAIESFRKRGRAAQ